MLCNCKSLREEILAASEFRGKVFVIAKESDGVWNKEFDYFLIAAQFESSIKSEMPLESFFQVAFII